MKKRIAILGGGVGAMTAAYQLTQFPDWQNRFDITVYQMGWRLGGKCASGRNAANGQRIEEHGLHVWAGFYDNAIALMKRCHRDASAAGIDGLFADFDAAFKPFNNVVIADQHNGKWLPWTLRPPFNDEIPGEGSVLLEPWDYFKMALDMLRDANDSAPPAAQVTCRGCAADMPHSVGHALRQLSPTHHVIQSPLCHLHDFVGALPTPSGLAGNEFNPLHAATMLFLLGEMALGLRERVEDESLDDDTRRLVRATDLVLAVLRGVLVDGVLLHGFDSIDDQEISAWMKKHGAHPISLEWSATRGLYDYAFGFSNGVPDYAHRAIAAGTSIRGLCRLFFTYKQALFFEMQAGMGDTVFTPLYKVLKAGGVKFRFFHKVTALTLDPARPRIQSIRLQRQAELAAGRTEYQPLVRVKGLDCWPSAPDLTQLDNPAALASVNFETAWTDWPGTGETMLNVERDFDEVILGISLGALADISGELAARSARWANMLDRVKTVRTMAMQLWFKSGSAELGCTLGEPVLSCYEEPLNTWADLSHLLAVEDWPVTNTPRSIAYCCGPLEDDPAEPPHSDTGYPARALAAATARSRDWATRHLPWIWPKLVAADGTLDWTQLVTQQPLVGEARFDAQYFRANIDPSERYVLSVPGSTRFRLPSDQSGFDNLWLAGDWTYNGINAGCVEAATMSGMRAAAGLAGEALDIVGETDLPRPAPPAAPVPWQSLAAQNQTWPWSALYGVLQTAAVTSVVPMPRAAVAACLPPGLELAPQSLTDAASHPVVLLFSWQNNVRPNLVPVGFDYHEFVVCVPFIQHISPAARARAPGPLACLPRLFLDSHRMVWLGVHAYGYPKKFARIDAGQRDYIVRNPASGAPMISASYRAAGATGGISDFPRLDRLRVCYEQPIVSRLRGRWVYSYYDFGLGCARLQPTELTIQIHDRQIAGLPTGVYPQPSIADSPFGSFFMNTSATLTNALASEPLTKTLREHAHPMIPDWIKSR